MYNLQPENLSLFSALPQNCKSLSFGKLLMMSK